MSDPIQKNKRYWNRASVAYQESHGASLEEAPLSWGVWRIPEAELQVLGETQGRDVLELGCGGAQWAVALVENGARAVGVDFSREQLRDARARGQRRDVELPLLLGNAESLPLADASFDIVFCDHGAMSFARPEPCVAEVARVLRPGGLFAFCTASPILTVCWNEASDKVGTTLEHDYFGLNRLEDGESVVFQRTYGDWIRIFRDHGLAVEDLIEPRPPADATTTYSDYAPLEWARRFPGEALWKLRKP